MSRSIARVCAALSICLSLAVTALPVQALSGPETAQRFNQAYISTPDHCVDGAAAYYCSGVMVKQVKAGDPSPFWSHGPEALARGAELFDYLRSDVATAPLSESSGYLFSDRQTAIGQNKDYELRGDDGMSRPPQLMVVNWGTKPPAQLPVEAVFHRRTAEGLRAALSDQYAWFRATGSWLPVLRLDPDDPKGKPFGFSAREQIYTGYQVADRINQRYADTQVSCLEGRSALHCNGVFIRGTGFGPTFHSWNPSPNSVGRDGVSFAWVRADNGVQSVASPGLIFSELSKPLAQSVRFRCAYPANAGTSGISNSCRALCTAQNVTTVAAWRARYGTSPGSSCTFGDTPAEIQLNTDVRMGQAWAPGHTELIIGAWPQNIPTQLPIEAFFYVPSANSLPGARYIQDDYFKVTGQFMPILRVDLTAAAGSRFMFLPEDQSFSVGAMEQLRTLEFPPPRILDSGDADCVGCDQAVRQPVLP